MLPDAILIGRSNINFEVLLGTAKQVLGRSISKTLDSQGKDITKPISYLTLLSEIKNNSFNADDAGHLLAHYFYTFAIACDPKTLNDLLEQSRLKIISAEGNSMHFAVVSGTLEEWRTAIINCCSEQSSFNLRLLFDKIFLMFEQEGLLKLFMNYKKRTLPDRTFKLLER
jgi:hypothetical protein